MKYPINVFIVATMLTICNLTCPAQAEDAPSPLDATFQELATADWQKLSEIHNVIDEAVAGFEV